MHTGGADRCHHHIIYSSSIITKYTGSTPHSHFILPPKNCDAIRTSLSGFWFVFHTLDL